MAQATAMSGGSMPQMGGLRPSVLEEVQQMSGNILLVGLVLVSVYVSRIPPETLSYFRSSLVQFVSLVAIFLLTARFGWIHGILAVLAFALVVSTAVRTSKAGFVDYTPAVIFSNGIDTTLVPTDNRWFVERVLGENPFLIREREVKTSAVQDLSDKSMTNSSVSK